jgi:hypothetical protein
MMPFFFLVHIGMYIGINLLLGNYGRFVLIMNESTPYLGHSDMGPTDSDPPDQKKKKAFMLRLIVSPRLRELCQDSPHTVDTRKLN